jgi:hypothetical protein
MKPPRLAITGFILGFTLGVAQAQEVRVIDLRSQDLARAEPKVVGGSGTGGSIGGNGVRIPGDLSLEITSIVISRVGKDFADYKLRLINHGSQSVVIPIETELKKLSTPEELTHLNFSILSFYLSVADSNGRSRHLPTSNIALYGREDAPNSLLELRPGTWITIVGRTDLDPQSMGKGGLEAHAISRIARYRRTEEGLFMDSKQLSVLDSARFAMLVGNSP